MSKTHIRKNFFVLVAGVAFLSAILAACAGPTPELQVEPTATAVATPGEVQRVTPEEAKAAFDSGAAVFLDVRSHTIYLQSHIPGALSIPLAELKPRIAELDPGQWIITYCT
jgi:3-mercaptopyruvate sulfurtransferase SseA